MIGPSIANGYREISTITGTRKAQETDAPNVHSATNELQNLQSRSIGHVSAIVARVKAGIYSALIVYRAHKAALTFSSGQRTGFANYAVPKQPAGIAGDRTDTRFPRPRCQRCGKTRCSTLFHLQRCIYREGAHFFVVFISVMVSVMVLPSSDIGYYNGPLHQQSLLFTSAPTCIYSLLCIADLLGSSSYSFRTTFLRNLTGRNTALRFGNQLASLSFVWRVGMLRLEHQ
jgi:hypothetical protein